MPKRINHIEPGIEFFPHPKVGHIAHSDGCRKSVPNQSGITEFHSLRIQIISADFMPQLCQLDQQTSGTTRRFKDSPHGPTGMLRKTTQQELKFGFPVGSEQQVIILGIVVNTGLNIVRHGTVSETKAAEYRQTASAVGHFSLLAGILTGLPLELRTQTSIHSASFYARQTATLSGV
jgi:hypothetical protein